VLLLASQVLLLTTLSALMPSSEVSASSWCPGGKARPVLEIAAAAAGGTLSHVTVASWDHLVNTYGSLQFTHFLKRIPADQPYE